jgi:exocyst complex component 7
MGSLLFQKLAPTLMNGAKYDQDEYVGALQKLLVAISFLEKHRSYEGSGKALEQARELLSQARRKCKADFLSAVAVLSRGSRREETNKLAWGKPNKEDVAKAAQLLACLLSSHVDLAELMGDYGKQRFQVVKMFLSDDGSSSSSGVQFSVAEPLGVLAQRLSDIETTLEAEKTLAEAVFSSEELCHAAFRHAAHPMLESWKTDLDASLQSITSINKQQQLQTSSAIADPFKLLLLHELLSARLKGMDSLVQPPLLLRDRKGKTPLDDPWVLTKLLGAILADVALGTKQRLFGFQVELTEQIGVGDRSLTKDGNVHPVSSHVRSLSIGFILGRSGLTVCILSSVDAQLCAARVRPHQAAAGAAHS